MSYCDSVCRGPGFDRPFVTIFTICSGACRRYAAWRIQRPLFRVRPLRSWSTLLQPSRLSGELGGCNGVRPTADTDARRQANKGTAFASGLSAPAMSSPRNGSGFPIDHGVGRCQPAWRPQVLDLRLSQPLGRSVPQAWATRRGQSARRRPAAIQKLRFLMTANSFREVRGIAGV